MSDRRAELEAKKAKLEQLRKLKEQRRQEKESRDRTNTQDIGMGLHSKTALKTTSATSLMGDSHSSTDLNSSMVSNSDLDDLLKGVGLFPGLTSAPIKHSQDSSAHSGTHPLGNNHVNPMSPDSGTSSELTPTPTIHVQQKLAESTFPEVSFPPREQVTYEKQTQTTSTSSNTGSMGSNNDRDSPVGLKSSKKGFSAHDYYVIHWDEEWDDEFQTVLTTIDDPEDTSLFADQYVNNHHHNNNNNHNQASHRSDGSKDHSQQQQQQQQHPSLPHVEMVKPAQTQEDVQAAEEQRKKPKRLEYSEDERRHIVHSESFKKFLDRAMRITERALACSDSMDIFVDYTGQIETGESEDKSGMALSLSGAFIDERWSKDRAITSFDWCTQYPELLLTSYDRNEKAPNDPDGICLVWNMKFKKTTPEYIFHCQSPVTSATFAKFHPNLILGGTHSGQIVLWDNRSGKRGPVQRSPLAASTHTHPVYCLKVVGSQSSHNLISISNDGKLCSWSLDMLSQPQETMELAQQKQTRQISSTVSMSFPVGDFNNFVMGSQDGAVYSTCRHGAKAGILDIHEGHQGPVTAVDFHCASSSQVDFSSYYLTSSLDYTFKLWSLKEEKPIYSFEDGNDYLFDVRWSPIHPALFATADGLGKLDIWNLNNDTELPTASATVEGNPNPALSRLLWSPNGQQLVVGDDGGRVSVFDVGEQLALPKKDEWTRFANTLQYMH